MRTTYKPKNEPNTSTQNLSQVGSQSLQRREEVKREVKSPPLEQPKEPQREVKQPFNPERLMEEAKQKQQIPQILPNEKFGKQHQEEYKQLYFDLVEANDIMNSMDAVQFTSNDVPPKKNTWKVVVAVVSVILIISGVVFIKFIKPNKEEVAETTEVTTEATTEIVQDELSEIKAEINRYYTSEEKQDLLTGITQDSLQGTYDKIAGYEANGVDISSVKAELDNISTYIQDKSLVYNYMSVETDLTSITESDLATLKESVNGYIVPGLALTITNQINTLEQDISTYNTLYNELSSFEDYINYDVDKYEKAIQGISHTPNRLTLSEMHGKLVAKKAEAQGVKELDDKAKEEADKAKDKALEEANKAKENAETELNDTKDKLKNALDKVKNKVTDPTEATTQQQPTEAQPEGTSDPTQTE